MHARLTFRTRLREQAALELDGALQRDRLGRGAEERNEVDEAKTHEWAQRVLRKAFVLKSDASSPVPNACGDQNSSVRRPVTWFSMCMYPARQ